MKIFFHLLLASSLLAFFSNAQLQSGCQKHNKMLICSAEPPYSEDLQSPDIQTLVMARLPEGTWLTITNPELINAEIQKIEIQKSSVARVDKGYFATISGKNKLKRLSFKNVEGQLIVDKNMLQGLEKSLNYLSVTNGLTVNMADLAELEYLTNLELIDTTVLGTPGDFEKILPKLRSLEIKNCNLNQFPWEALAKWVANTEPKRLKISDNNWMCDCSMLKLKRLEPSILESEIQRITCAAPANLAGKKLSELTEKDLCPEGESESKQSGVLEASGSTSGEGSNTNLGAGGSEIGGSSGSDVQEAKDVKESGVRTEVIIAGSVIGVLVLAFVVFLIIYKCRIFSRGKAREERASRTHQNKRYVNVIEEPPLQQFGTNGRAKENGKYSEGAPV